jgi:hypothetical protein
MDQLAFLKEHFFFGCVLTGDADGTDMMYQGAAAL